MAKSVTPEEIEKTLRGITVPSRPKVLLQIENELRKADPDPRVIARLISADVGLTAAILKTVNSPFFGLAQRITSIAQAVSLMGMKTAAQIVTGLLVRTSFASPAGGLENFWDTAESIAGFARHIAAQLPGGPRDDAYCFGLFHDVGIPMLMQKFPTYRQTLIAAAGSSESSFTAVEREAHGTDHATLGYLIAKGWFLPEDICEGILSHHDVSVFDDDKGAINPRALTLIAINSLAEYFHDKHVLQHINSGWEQMGSQAMAHLGLTDDECADLFEELGGLLH